MKPINFHEDEFILKGNASNVSDLPVVPVHFGHHGPALVSCWKLTLKERLLALFLGRVFLIVLGVRHPAVYLSPSLAEAGLDDNQSSPLQSNEN